MKDHEIAAVVNELKDIAIKFHSVQQLRERIAHVIVPILKAQKVEHFEPDEVRWCGNCGEGVTFFCRSKTIGNCPKGLGKITATKE